MNYAEKKMKIYNKNIQEQRKECRKKCDPILISIKHLCNIFRILYVLLALSWSMNELAGPRVIMVKKKKKKRYWKQSV